jgi:hypothetical protein
VRVRCGADESDAHRGKPVGQRPAGGVATKSRCMRTSSPIP